MPRSVRKIQVDTSMLKRDTGRLTVALEFEGREEARAQAERTADRLRAKTPVRTGALRDTIGVVATYVYGRGKTPGGEGYGVTYGTGLGRYPWVVNARQKTVKKGARGSRVEFQRALQTVLDREVTKL